MKPFAILLFFLTASTPAVLGPNIRYFRFERPVANLPQSGKQTCLVIDPSVFAHAAPHLADLRLYRGSSETPYALRVMAPVESGAQEIAPLNLGRRGGDTVFDAAMPAGSYRDIRLHIEEKDFIAAVAVSGSQEQTGAPETRLASYTIFDLSRQKLGRSTILHLPESDFRFLHFQISGPVRPEAIKGLEVVRAALNKPSYVVVASTSQVVEKGHESMVEFSVPARTPVDRVVFEPGASPADFSRDVRISVFPIAKPVSDAEPTPLPAQTFGNILRIHRTEAGHLINEEQVSVAAPSEVLDSASKWSVTVENGDDAPLQLKAVRLEMVERKMCFDAVPGAGYSLYYGDPALTIPQYDYATLFVPQRNAAQAVAGPEALNPSYEQRPDTRPFTEKHPALLWIALVLVIAILGVIGARSAGRAAPPQEPHS